MKEKTTLKSKILFVVLLILSLAWIYPVFMILINSFKTDRNITTRTVFQLPNADSFAVKLCGCTNLQGFCKGIWLQSDDHDHLSCTDSDLLLYVCMVYHKSQWHHIQDFIFPLCIFYGSAIPDVDVYLIFYGRQIGFE